MRGACTAIALALAVPAICLWAVSPARADDAQQVSLTAIPPEDGAEHETFVLSARISDDEGPLGGLPVTFYIVTTVFGERLMKVGDTLSDANGIASVVYTPTWTGDHTVMAHFHGNEQYAAAETSFHFDATIAESAWEPAEFGLDPIRAALPFAVGLAVVVVWGSLGFALINTVMGIRSSARLATATARQQVMPYHIGLPPPSVAQDQTAKRVTVALLLLAAAAALPLIWLTLRVSEEEDAAYVTVTGEGAGGDHGQPVAGEPLPTTLVRHVPTVTFDVNGQPTAGSVPMPADLAITAGRVRILDSTGGRIVTVAPDGELIPIQQGRGADGTSLKGSSAMASLGERLFVVSANGDRIVVVDESGLIEGSIVPSLPAGQATPSIAGIALSDSGTIWLSDAANHRVIRLNGHGEFELIIGLGAASSDVSGFDTPSGLAVDEDGNLYISDSQNGVVKKYSPLGVLLQVIGEGHLSRPQGVAVATDRRIFVADSAAVGVSVFGPDGSYLGVIRDQTFEELHVVRTSAEQLYVLDTLAGMLVFQAVENEESAP